MATVQHPITAKISGEWLVDKESSDDMDGIFELQGFGWFIRAALKVAIITVSIESYTDDDAVTHLMVSNQANFGPKPRPIHRILDWRLVESDTEIGSMKFRSRFIEGQEISPGTWEPKMEIQMKTTGEEMDDKVKKFLTDPVKIKASEESETEEKPEWVHHFVQNDNGWVSEEIVGFELIGDKVRFTRRMAIFRDGKIYLARTVFSPKT